MGALFLWQDLLWHPIEMFTSIHTNISTDQLILLLFRRIDSSDSYPSSAHRAIMSSPPLRLSVDGEAVTLVGSKKRRRIFPTPRLDVASMLDARSPIFYHNFYDNHYSIISFRDALSANFGFGWFFVPPEKIALLTLC